MSIQIMSSAEAGSWHEDASHSGMVTRALAWLRARRAHRRQMRELLTLDSRMLSDIGMTRSQAEYLAQQPYAGDWSAALFPRGSHRRS